MKFRLPPINLVVAVCIAALAGCDPCIEGGEGGGVIEIPAPNGDEAHEGALGVWDSSWERPSTTCEAGDGTESYYDRWTINNSWFPRDATVEIEVIGGSLGRPMLFIYEPFDFPDNPLSCLHVSEEDDRTPVIVHTASLREYVVVVTSVDDVDDEEGEGCGTYRLHLSSQ